MLRGHHVVLVTVGGAVATWRTLTQRAAAALSSSDKRLGVSSVHSGEQTKGQRINFDFAGDSDKFRFNQEEILLFGICFFLQLPE